MQGLELPGVYEPVQPDSTDLYLQGFELPSHVNPSEAGDPYFQTTGVKFAFRTAFTLAKRFNCKAPVAICGCSTPGVRA